MKKVLVVALAAALGGCAQLAGYCPPPEKPAPAPAPHARKGHPAKAAAVAVPVAVPSPTPNEAVKSRWHFPAILRHEIQR